MPDVIACRDCGRRWTARREAHCPGCCRHFTSDSAFDAHLVAPPPVGPRPFQTCRDPAGLRTGKGTPRLVQAATRWGPAWGWPGERPAASIPGRDPDADPDRPGSREEARQERRSGAPPRPATPVGGHPPDGVHP